MSEPNMPEAEPVARRSRSFAADALTTYGTNVAVAVLSLLNVFVIGRFLGPTGRGGVVLLTTIANLTHYTSLFGVQQANVNFAGTDPTLRRSLATNSIGFSVAFGLLGAGVVALLVVLVPAIGGDSSGWLLALALGSIPLLLLRTYLAYLVQADYRYTLTNVGWLLAPIVNVVGNGLFAAIGILTVGSAVATWVTGQALNGLLIVWFILRRSVGFGRPDLGLARRSLGFGLKSHAGMMTMMGNYRLDQWILGSIRGERELGLYSVAVAWSEALFYLPNALAAVQRPDLVRASRRDSARQASTNFRVTTIATIPLAVGMIVLAPYLCVTVFGESFHGSILDLRILVPGVFGITALKLFGSALVAQRKPLQESGAIGSALVITILLDILLIPRFGRHGAAVASLVAYTVGGIVVIAVFRRVLGGLLSELVPRVADVRHFTSRLRSLESSSTPAVPMRAAASAAEAPPGVDVQ